MSLNSDSLRKILELERKKGYSNRAVAGGLDKFLLKWATHAAASMTKGNRLTRFNKLCVIGSNYACLPSEERRKWVADLLDFLSEPKAESVKRGKTLPPIKTESSGPKLTKTSGKSIDSPVSMLGGVGTNLASKLDRLGVSTIRDILYFFPHRHLDYSQRRFISQLVEGEEQTIIANIWQSQQIRLGGKLSTEAIVGDETGNVRVVWFNNPYVAKSLRTDVRVVLSGRVSLFRGRHVFESPEWELAEDGELIHTGRLVPIYSITQGLRPRQVRKLVKHVIDEWAWLIEDFLPSKLKERCHLMSLPEAITQAHYPETPERKDRARVRLAFDELFLLQLGVLSKKRDWQESQPGNPFKAGAEVLHDFAGSLPFELTLAQQRVLNEIIADLQQAKPMSRLLQGEVGSGKTVVATAALILAIANGYQGALMAPTEILAEQHFTNISQLLCRIGKEERQEHYIHIYSGLLPQLLRVALLVGDAKQSMKQEMQQRIRNGDVDLIVGTHALIQKGVEFRRLGMVVIDEQHRFGVNQRSTLRQKGFSPHVLAMTATPIPRTLALTLYGDLDLSVIDQLPPDRKEIKTKWLSPGQRGSAYTFLRRQVMQGRQAFIICPLVEESEIIQAKAATAEYIRLSGEVFPELRLGLLHGRMPAVEKEKIMRRFRAGEFDILVSTPVVEVGVDVPNATVMLVESADRFGLSQLHQFRGRVGRGQEQSYCMLLAENPSEVARARLDIIEQVQNGFVLAEEDLKLRGPGEFFGTRQSGLPDLRMAKISDVGLMELARSEATRLFQIDPGLEKLEHRPLVKELARVWTTESSEWS